MYVRKGALIDRGNHKEAIQFVGPDAARGSDTRNVKGMQRKIAAQAKEIARLKAQMVTAQLKRGNAAAAQVAQSRPLPSAAWVSLEARIAKLEAAARPSTGPIVVDGETADQLGLMGMKRHANATGRPVHVLGPSKHHEGRIVEPYK